MASVEDGRKLDSHLSEVNGIYAFQIGEFGEYITENESNMISEMAFALAGKAKNVELQASVGIECSVWEKKTFVSDSEALGEGLVESRDQRSMLSKLFHVGTISVCISSLSQEASAQIIMMSWPKSPIVVCVNEVSKKPIPETRWLGEGVIPPPLLLNNCLSVLVSFYHGTSISFYGQNVCGPKVVDLLLPVLNKYKVVLTLRDFPL